MPVACPACGLTVDAPTPPRVCPRCGRLIGPDPALGPASPGAPAFVEESTGRGVRFTGKPPALAGGLMAVLAAVPLVIAVVLMGDPKSPPAALLALGFVVLVLGFFSALLFYMRVLIEVSRDGIVVHERPFGAGKNGSYAPRDVTGVAWGTRTGPKGRITHHVMLMLADGRSIEPGFQMSNDGEATYVSDRLRTAIRNAGGKC